MLFFGHSVHGHFNLTHLIHTRTIHTRLVELTFVDFQLTVDALIAWPAVTCVGIYAIIAHTIHTGVALTLINVNFTIVT